MSFTKPSCTELVLVGLGLSLLASFMPLILYLFALMLFGLPHVLWEFNWVRQTYGAKVPTALWWSWGIILGLQASVRLAVWLGWIDAELSLYTDMFSLLALLLVVLLVLMRTSSRLPFFRLSVLMAVGSGLIATLYTQNIVAVLVILAIAHNFTPLLLVPASQHFAQLPSRRVLLSLFSLPLLILGLSVAISLPAADSDLWMPSEAQWLQQYAPQWASGLLSAVILAQCLHYYSVLRLMPSTLAIQVPLKIAGLAWQWWALTLSTPLSIYFLYDFTQARQLYAVAAGIHAWLELPLIALLLTVPTKYFALNAA
jgi:hypothetical protein